MPGSGTLLRVLTESLLRSRLRPVVLIFLVAAIVWLGIDLLAEQAFGLPFQVPWLLVLAGVAALLYSRRPLQLLRLRALELVLFGAAVAYLSARDYAFIYWAHAGGQTSLALSGFTVTVLHVVLLVVVYGMFIPNTLKRAATVAVAVVATPIAAGLLLALSFAPIAEAVGQLGAGPGG